MKDQTKLIQAVEQLIEAVTGGEKITFKRLVEIKTLITAIKAEQVKSEEMRALHVSNEN